MEIKKKNWALFWLALLLTSVLFGQLFRLDLFKSSAGGILISDVLVVGLSGLFGLLLLAGKEKLPRASFVPWFFAWVGVVILSYLIQVPHYHKEQLIVGLGYLARLVAYFSLLVISYRLWGKMPFAVGRYVGYLALILLILGWIIWIILPDFSILAPLGWDPHQGRLTSTWLDPNYFGTFLALLFAFFLPFARQIEKKNSLWYGLYLFFLFILWLGMYFCYSRSALGTFLVGALFVASQLSWRTVGTVMLLFVTTFALPSQLQSRLTQTVNLTAQETHLGQGITASPSPVSQAGNVDTASAQATDPNTQARIQSWKRAITIFKHAPILGAGYNFYQYEAQDLGIFSAQTVAKNRSVAGSDSSLLTLLATTGLVGIIVFLALWWNIFWALWRQRKQPFILGALGLTIAWFASSFFNNTLLYAPIMLPVLILIGVALAQAQELAKEQG